MPTRADAGTSAARSTYAREVFPWEDLLSSVADAPVSHDEGAAQRFPADGAIFAPPISSQKWATAAMPPR